MGRLWNFIVSVCGEEYHEKWNSLRATCRWAGNAKGNYIRRMHISSYIWITLHAYIVRLSVFACQIHSRPTEKIKKTAEQLPTSFHSATLRIKLKLNALNFSECYSYFCLKRLCSSPQSHIFRCEWNVLFLQLQIITTVMWQATAWHFKNNYY